MLTIFSAIVQFILSCIKDYCGKNYKIDCVENLNKSERQIIRLSILAFAV